MAAFLFMFAWFGAATGSPIKMQPLGAYCGGYGVDKATALARSCDETTPVIWKGNLVLVEHHREFRVRNQRYNGIGDNSLIIDKIPGSANIAFASAHVSWI